MSCSPGQSCCPDCVEQGAENLAKRRDEITELATHALDDLARTLNAYGADVDHDTDKLDLYAQQLGRFENQWNSVDDAWFSDDGLVKSFFAQLRAFAQQVQATVERSGLGFWDGFWEALGVRYVELLNDLPTPREVFTVVDRTSQQVPMILLAAVAVVALYYLGPLARRRA